MPAIIDDDRKHAQLGHCANCDRDDILVRPVEAIGHHGQSRGWYKACFDCFKPRITWRPRGEHSHSYVSPAKEATDETD